MGEMIRGKWMDELGGKEMFGAKCLKRNVWKEFGVVAVGACRWIRQLRN